MSLIQPKKLKNCSLCFWLAVKTYGHVPEVLSYMPGIDRQILCCLHAYNPSLSSSEASQLLSKITFTFQHLAILLKSFLLSISLKSTMVVPPPGN